MPRSVAARERRHLRAVSRGYLCRCQSPLASSSRGFPIAFTIHEPGEQDVVDVELIQIYAADWVCIAWGDAYESLPDQCGSPTEVEVLEEIALLNAVGRDKELALSEVDSSRDACAIDSLSHPAGTRSPQPCLCVQGECVEATSGSSGPTLTESYVDIADIISEYDEELKVALSCLAKLRAERPASSRFGSSGRWACW